MINNANSAINAVNAWNPGTFSFQTPVHVTDVSMGVISGVAVGVIVWVGVIDGVGVGKAIDEVLPEMAMGPRLPLKGRLDLK
ncbi:MAG: hypothetical protein M8349_06720 [ANME-2 cluster archaeon]|nr:hypothetical protein [ANME-2 cluster archaeon]